MSLVGKFVFHSGPEHWQQGTITEEPYPGYVLVAMENCMKKDGPPNVALVAVADMTTDFHDEDMLGMCFWQFFNTKAELDIYTAWLEEPEDKRPKVVSLVKK